MTLRAVLLATPSLALVLLLCLLQLAGLDPIQISALYIKLVGGR